MALVGEATALVAVATAPGAVVGEATADVGVIAAAGVATVVGDPTAEVGVIAALGVVTAVGVPTAGAVVAPGDGVSAVLGTSARGVYWVATGLPPTLTVLTTLPEATSITKRLFCTRSLMNASRPSALNVTSDGPAPTVMVRLTLLVERSTTATRLVG